MSTKRYCDVCGAEITAERSTGAPCSKDFRVWLKLGEGGITANAHLWFSSELRPHGFDVCRPCAVRALTHATGEKEKARDIVGSLITIYPKQWPYGFGVFKVRQVNLKPGIYPDLSSNLSILAELVISPELS